MSRPIISATGVHMRFNTRKGPLTALEDFHLEVRRGEVLCIVGASGKSAQPTDSTETRYILVGRFLSGSSNAFGSIRFLASQGLEGTSDDTQECLSGKGRIVPAALELRALNCKPRPNIFIL